MVTPLISRPLPGYSFSPSHYQPPIGHAALDVYLMDNPVERGFDVHSVQFQIFDHGEIRPLKVTHPWQTGLQAGILRVYPGRFKLSEFEGDTFYGLCLGGELRVQLTAEYTHCSLASSAPIFNLGEAITSPGMVIASEVEVLLAERLAAWGQDEEGFLRRLESIDPLRLFISMLAGIEAEQKRIPDAARGSIYWNEEHTLHAMIRGLDQAGQWPQVPPRLEDLV